MRRKGRPAYLEVQGAAGMIVLLALISSMMLALSAPRASGQSEGISISFEIYPSKPSYSPGDEFSINITAVNTLQKGDYVYDSLAYMERLTNLSVHFAWMGPNEFAWRNVSNVSHWLAPDGAGVETLSLNLSVPPAAAGQTYSYFFRIEYMSHTPWGNITYLWGSDTTYHDFTVASGTESEPGPSLGTYLLGAALGLAIAAIALGMVVYWRNARKEPGPPATLDEEPEGVTAVLAGPEATPYPVIRAAPGEQFPIEKGFIYLVKEKRPNVSFAMFKEAVNHDAKGMLVVREHPNRLKQMYSFDATKILWLTRRVGVDHIDPTELSLLSLEVTKFVQGTPKSVVLLEGLEYIITQNDFETVLRFVNHLHDFVLAHDCAIIIAVDPRVLSTRELALLERSARIVEPMEPAEQKAPEPPQEATA